MMQNHLTQQRQLVISTLLVLALANLQCHAYCMGNLNDRDIAGIWRLRAKNSFLPKILEAQFQPKEFTVFPPPKPMKTSKKEKGAKEDILLLLREDGNFVQYGNNVDMDSKKKKKSLDEVDGTSSLGTMKGSWALVDGKLILAADRDKDTQNIKTDGKKHDTILEGIVQAKSNPALQEGKPTDIEQNELAGEDTNKGKDEDVHLSVNGEISIGKFFYPLKHPNFFEQPIFGAQPTGEFELEQVLGNLNAKLHHEDELVEKFRKKNIMDKRFFLTQYPLPTKRTKRQRWSIKYNKYVDEKPPSKFEQERAEQEKNAPMQIKSFEVELFANNTFSTITGLGDTILRGKWSIIGEERDQLWMSVWRFGFGREVSGSTFSEGSHLTHQDDVSFWGKIYEVDASDREDNILDDPKDWKGTKIEINGAVMIGWGLEPCSIARFTMIEKTEEDYTEEDEEDDDNDDFDLPDLPFDIGSFE